VLATGSTWRGDGVQSGLPVPMAGADPMLPWVLTPEQVCAGKRPPGRRVVVYDADGYYVGPGLAELLTADGLDVTIVTPFPVLSPVSDETLEGEMLRAHVHDAGIKVMHAITVTQIHASQAGGTEAGGTEAGESVRLCGTDRYGEPWSAGCDGIVLVTQQASDDALHHELTADPEALRAAGISLFLIGDAVAPRMISEAIFDGHRLGREIDQPDPALPAPYRREHAELG
ncbi:MAG TPA: hypothetical protein VF834_24680, partial [Streptosporangiaceae bacterium]